MDTLHDIQDAVSTLSVPGPLKGEMRQEIGREPLSYPLSLGEEVLLTGKDAPIWKVVSQCVFV